MMSRRLKCISFIKQCLVTICLKCTLCVSEYFTSKSLCLIPTFSYVDAQNLNTPQILNNVKILNLETDTSELKTDRSRSAFSIDV